MPQQDDVINGFLIPIPALILGKVCDHECSDTVWLSERGRIVHMGYDVTRWWVNKWSDLDLPRRK